MNLRHLCGWPLLPIAERLAQGGFHLSGIEIADNPNDDVVGMDVGLVPINQVLSRNCADGRVFRNAGVRICWAIRELHGLSMSNFTDLIITARDAVKRFSLG